MGKYTIIHHTITNKKEVVNKDVNQTAMNTIKHIEVHKSINKNSSSKSSVGNKT